MQIEKALVSAIIRKLVESFIHKGLLVLNDLPSSAAVTKQSIVSQPLEGIESSFPNAAKGPDKPLNEEQDKMHEVPNLGFQNASDVDVPEEEVQN